jgi:hypothetical protein
MAYDGLLIFEPPSSRWHDGMRLAARRARARPSRSRPQSGRCRHAPRLSLSLSLRFFPRQPDPESSQSRAVQIVGPHIQRTAIVGYIAVAQRRRHHPSSTSPSSSASASRLQGVLRAACRQTPRSARSPVTRVLLQRRSALGVILRAQRSEALFLFLRATFLDLDAARPATALQDTAVDLL